MRALVWHGKGDVRVDTVADPEIKHPRDAIIKVSSCAICGSDLHLLDGYQPTMQAGDILGHENMGVVVALGSEVTNLKIGDRVESEAREITLDDIEHFAEFTGDTFYAHMDEEAAAANPRASPGRNVAPTAAMSTKIDDRDAPTPCRACMACLTWSKIPATDEIVFDVLKNAAVSTAIRFIADAAPPKPACSRGM